VTTDSANLIIAQLLFLEAEDPDKEINLYINSPGGMVTAGLAVYDTMQTSAPNYHHLHGKAMSFGAVLLTAGTKGKRFALPNSRIMIHQPLISGGGINWSGDGKLRSKPKRSAIQSADFKRNIAKHTGQTALIKLPTTRNDNFYLSAEQAKV